MARVYSFASSSSSSSDRRRRLSPVVKQEEPPAPTKIEPVDVTAPSTTHELNMMSAVAVAMNDAKGKKPETNTHELMEPALQLLGLATAQQQQQQQQQPTAEKSRSTSPQPNDEYYKRGSWTAEEDELLVQGIRQFGYGRWKEIASIIPGRRGKQLKQRWDNSLSSKYVDSEWLQSKIQEQEEEPAEKLFRLFETSDWAEIAQRITERAREGNGAEVIEALLSHALMNQTYLFQQQQQQHSQQQQQQQQQQPQHHNPSQSSPPPPQQLSQPRPSSAPRKRRRSDPALADTQSAAMSIYASATPVTTTVDNQVQTVYPCLFPNCGKSFARLYNLKSHSRTHTDDRPFVCQFCQAAFSRNHDLKRHSKIHGQEKPYKCLGCNKDFSRLDALKRHKNNKRNKPACMAPDDPPQQSLTSLPTPSSSSHP